MAKSLKISDDLHARAKIRASRERIKLETLVEDGVRMRLAQPFKSHIISRFMKTK